MGKAPTEKETSNEEETSTNRILHADRKLCDHTSRKDALADANDLWPTKNNHCSSHNSFLHEGRREDEAQVLVWVLTPLN